MIFHLKEGPVSRNGQFKLSLDNFYVTDIPLSVTKVEMVSLNKVLTIFMLQIVFQVLLTDQKWQCFI